MGGKRRLSSFLYWLELEALSGIVSSLVSERARKNHWNTVLIIVLEKNIEKICLNFIKVLAK